MKRLEQGKEEFERALKALEQAVLEAESDLEIDGMIQRFEFTNEPARLLTQSYERGGEKIII